MSRLPLKSSTEENVDTGYIGITKWCANVNIPKKKSKLHPPIEEDRIFNKTLASKRISVEHVIGALKRFKIISDRYRNRRKRLA